MTPAKFTCQVCGAGDVRTIQLAGEIVAVRIKVCRPCEEAIALLDPDVAIGLLVLVSELARVRAFLGNARQVARPGGPVVTCAVCGSGAGVRLYAVTIDGKALRVAPHLCRRCGDAFLVAVGGALGTLLRDGGPEKPEQSDSGGLTLSADRRKPP